MRRELPLIAVLLGLVVAAGAPAQSPESEPGWNLKSDSGGLKIYNREKPDSPIKELLTITTIDLPVWRLAAVIGDYDHFKDFMPYTVVSKCTRHEEAGPKKAVNYFFTALDVPLVTSRYYTLRLVDEWNPDGKAGAFRSKWSRTKEAGRDLSWDDPSVRALFPAGFKEPIKTPINEGYWLLEPVDGGRQTKVTYYVFTDPGGKIPSWIANQANSVAVPKLMKAVRERGRESRYDAMAPK
jgi:hypothetical protein